MVVNTILLSLLVVTEQMGGMDTFFLFAVWA